MSGFAIRNPYFIVVVCLIIAVVGADQPRPHAGRHVPGDRHSGGRGRDVLFRHAARADRSRHHRPLRALLHARQRHRAHRVALPARRQHHQGLSSSPGTNPDSAVTTISNLAMAELRRLPPGTLPPVVLKFDASSLPVCLITLKGEGLDETQLRDIAQYAVRNQVAGVPGASRPAAVRRPLPADHGLRRPAQARSAPAQPHGRGARRQRTPT